MPVFLAGKNFGRTVANVLDGAYHEFSHQEGHIMAAVHSCGMELLVTEPFLVFHLSGGTTELLLARRDRNGFDVEIVGGTRDLPAGQFIDRIGTLLGLSFPAGAALDQLASSQVSGPAQAAAVEDGYFHFSGPETKYRRLYEQGTESGVIACSVMDCIGRTVLKAVRQCKQKYHVDTVLMVGGVSSSITLRKLFEEEPGVYFASPAFSTDNAAGICLLGKEMRDDD